MKLYDIGGLVLFLIIAAGWGKGVYTLEQATDSGKNPTTKEELIQELYVGYEPIASQEDYKKIAND